MVGRANKQEQNYRPQSKLETRSRPSEEIDSRPSRPLKRTSRDHRRAHQGKNETMTACQWVASKCRNRQLCAFSDLAYISFRRIRPPAKPVYQLSPPQKLRSVSASSHRHSLQTNPRPTPEGFSSKEGSLPFATS